MKFLSRVFRSRILRIKVYITVLQLIQFNNIVISAVHFPILPLGKHNILVFSFSVSNTRGVIFIYEMRHELVSHRPTCTTLYMLL